MELRGIDRPSSQLGAGYDCVLFSQAEQIKKENIDVISSRCTPASKNWVVNSQPRSMIIYDANPNRIDHWIETAIANGLYKIDFDFIDHPGYFDEDGNETELFQRVYSRLDRLEGVWRQRLLEGKAANAEGTIFELNPCHFLDKLPEDFETNNTFYRGFDFGMKDPNVCLWVAEHNHTGDIIIFKEWRRRGVDTIEMGHAVNENTGREIQATIIDNDENLQSILKEHCDIDTFLAEKGPNSIRSGLTLIENKLEKARRDEDGGLYFFNDPVGRCPIISRENEPQTIIDESELYAYRENSDKPVDKFNHGWDCLRYVLDFIENKPMTFGDFGRRVGERQKKF